MKKLNITKKHFNESKYFTSKYGKLEYVSESGKVYKTDKGKILKFNESESGEVSIQWLIDDDVLGIVSGSSETISVDLDLIDPNDSETLIDAINHELARTYDGMYFTYDDEYIIENEDEFWNSIGVKPNRTGNRMDESIQNESIDEDDDRIWVLVQIEDNGDTNVDVFKHKESVFGLVDSDLSEEDIDELLDNGKLDAGWCKFELWHCPLVD